MFALTKSDLKSLDFAVNANFDEIISI